MRWLIPLSCYSLAAAAVCGINTESPESAINFFFDGKNCIPSEQKGFVTVWLLNLITITHSFVQLVELILKCCEKTCLCLVTLWRLKKFINPQQGRRNVQGRRDWPPLRLVRYYIEENVSSKDLVLLCPNQNYSNSSGTALCKCEKCCQALDHTFCKQLHNVWLFTLFDSK